MSITETKINNVIVKPLIKTNEIDISTVKGGNLLPIYNNLSLICASRNSGKTTALSTIALKTTSKNTVFWIFSPSTNVDATMMELIRRLESRGNVVNIFPSLHDGKEDCLETIISAILKEENEPKEQAPKKPPIQDKVAVKFIRFGNEELKPVEKKQDDKEITTYKEPKYKPKKLSPQYCFIIDDLATELKSSKGLLDLCFNGRHIKASIYISYQYKNQLPPSLYEQASYIFLFKHLNTEKLKEIFLSVSFPKLTFEEFKYIYDYGTKETESNKFPFLLISTSGGGSFRKNFNKQINYVNE